MSLVPPHHRRGMASGQGPLGPKPSFKVGDQIKDGPEFVFERLLNHGWDDDGQLKVLVKWFGFPEQKATWQLAASLPREAIRKYCLRKRVKLPALTREGVLFSDQVGRQPLGAPVNSSYWKEKNTRREARPFIPCGARDQSIVRKTAPTPLRGGRQRATHIAEGGRKELLVTLG